MTRLNYLLFIFLISAICFRLSTSKPTAEVASTPDPLNPVHVEATASAKGAVDNLMKLVDVNRDQRSPQFGLLGGDYHDYSDYDDEPRHFKHGHKRKFHKLHHNKPSHGHGCQGYGCGGYPEHGGHEGYIGEPHPTGQGGSFASASAGSLGGGGHYGGHNQANAQSASFSFGPYTASFSVAQSSSHRKPF